MSSNQSSEESINAYAPGKVILHGEHAVVYGNKAIAVSVGLYTVIHIKPGSDSNVTVKFPDVFVNSSFSIDQLKELRASFGSDFSYEILLNQPQIPISDKVKESLKSFIEGQMIDQSKCVEELKGAQFACLQAFLFLYLAIFNELVSINLSIDTELPVGAGLGSSASFAVALAGGLLLKAKRILSTDYEKQLELINRWAFVSEQFVHGNPSGVDNSVATHGGGVLFQKGHDLQCLQTPEIHSLIVNTKVARSTKLLVEKVASLKSERPEYFQTLLDDVSGIVEQVVERMKRHEELGPAEIERNQEILIKFGVSHPRLDLIVEIAKQHNLSAKLTGAGGGGCAFILLPSNLPQAKLDSLKASLTQLDFEFWDTRLGARGFHIGEKEVCEKTTLDIS